MSNSCSRSGTATTSAAASEYAQAGPGSTVQPTARNAINAAGARLRRRLSKIFHRPSRPITFGRRPSGVGTVRPSHGRSCQSPRTQRCSRFA